MAKDEWRQRCLPLARRRLLLRQIMHIRRPGYTLIELLLVLALVVIAAAVVAPSVMQGGDRAELEDAADKLAAMWGRARLDAVSSGTTLMFQCELGGGLCRVQDPTAMLGMETEEAEQGVPTQGRQELEFENVVVQALAVAEPAGSEPACYDGAASAITPVVVFHPDGATSDAEVILEHANGMQMKVILRGLTGAQRVQEVEDPTNP